MNGRMDYQKFLSTKKSKEKNKKTASSKVSVAEKHNIRYRTYKKRVASMHDTSAGHCNLQNTTAVAADDLSPSDDTNMLLFMLHLYHVILSIGDDALRLF